MGARCTTPAGPLLKLGLGFLGHPRDWHYWTVHEPWQHLAELAQGKMSVEPKLGFEYILWAGKAQHANGPPTADGRPLS